MDIKIFDKCGFKIHGGQFESIKKCLIDGINKGISFSYANLKGADLREADLRGADLREADLRGADLRGADLRFANLRGADSNKLRF